MIAFDATGNVRWIVPNDQPQIATADGGVIGQSGIIYDKNGNATGQMALGGNVVPNWAGEIYTAGASGVQLNYSWVSYGAGFTSAAGGNPSGNGTSIANLGLSEGMPLWSLFGATPKCTLGTDKIALGGAALQQYSTAKQNLLTYLASLTPTSPCAKLLNVSQVTAAVTRQTPFDGILSNLSMYDAGIWNQKTTQLKTWPDFRRYPICSEFWYGPGIWSGTVAEAQTQPPATDVYIATQKKALSYLTPVTILHESLHNLTGLDDPDLYNLLTGKKLGPGPTTPINDALQQNGCVGTQ